MTQRLLNELMCVHSISLAEAMERLRDARRLIREGRSPEWVIEVALDVRPDYVHDLTEEVSDELGSDQV